MPPVDRPPASGPTYWRSLEEHAGTPEFRSLVERQTGGIDWENLAPATRRSFLKLMGASIAMAGLAGCRFPKDTIVPFSRPAGYVPGGPLSYATSMELNGVATGLLVTSYDGRPIKIEGNPGHPFSRGATDAIAQASVLEMYDPARSRSIVRREGGLALSPSWDEFAAFAAERFGALRQPGGAGLAVLSEASASPSVADMRARLLAAAPGARWYEYEAVSRDHEREGAILAFGRPLRAQLSLDRAAVIVCLDADPLSSHPAAVAYARDYTEGRRSADAGTMNRLYAIESVFSITGSVADHRFPVASRHVAVVAGQLAAAILPGASGPLASYTGHPFQAKFVARIARDLLANRGRGLVVAGPHQPAAVHALAHLMNAALGNAGATVRYTADPDPARPSHVAAIAALTSDMQAGRVDTLLVIGGNPVYDAPADVDFASALRNVPASLHLSLFEDETSRACHWHLPRAHYLESWGDARAWDGTLSPVQPLIEPLYGGRSAIELISLFLDAPPMTGHDIVRRTLQPLLPSADFERAWTAFLDQGVLPDSAWPAEQPAPRALDAIPLPAAPADGDGLEIVFCRDPKVHDGRFANNSWLQEMPDPMTRLTWDNAALMSPSTASGLGVKPDDLVTLRYRGREIEMATYVLPGLAPGSVAVALGYGRTAAGNVGDKVGFDSYRLRTSAAMDFDGGLAISRTGRHYALSCTQDHHAIDLVGLRAMHKRVGELVREADLAEYERDPRFAKREGEAERPPQLFPGQPYETGHQWGMSIDLNACTGCGACVVACQAENNVPVVGKDQVARGREMHWLRIDRYFSGEPEEPEVAHEPVACVHCENAPCEQVCPVGATSHSAEGLNEMVYNRCIGTRYCSNNCPYKVRRFNWFNFHRHVTDVEKMVYNPDVTVRSRGVMEKCTYCVQRIETVKIAAGNDDRPIADGEITPACAQVCPTRAIVFGDLNDPASQVRKLHAHQRAYGLLEELNTRPRTSYLAKVRNPNPEQA